MLRPRISIRSCPQQMTACTTSRTRRSFLFSAAGPRSKSRLVVTAPAEVKMLVMDSASFRMLTDSGRSRWRQEHFTVVIWGHACLSLQGQVKGTPCYLFFTFFLQLLLLLPSSPISFNPPAVRQLLPSDTQTPPASVIQKLEYPGESFLGPLSFASVLTKTTAAYSAINMLLIALLLGLCLSVTAFAESTSNFGPTSTSTALSDTENCDELFDQFQSCFSGLEHAYSTVVPTNTMHVDTPDSCSVLKPGWMSVIKSCGWGHHDTSATGRPTGRPSGRSFAPATNISPQVTAAPLDKRAQHCDTGYHYLTAEHSGFDYFFCCPGSTDKLFLPSADAGSPKCCKKGQKSCDQYATDSKEMCNPGLETTQYGGVAGCRSRAHKKNERDSDHSRSHSGYPHPSFSGSNYPGPGHRNSSMPGSGHPNATATPTPSSSFRTELSKSGTMTHTITITPTPNVVQLAGKPNTSTPPHLIFI